MSDAPQSSAASKYAHKGDLINGPVRGHLIRMTIPMIWGLFAVIFVQLIDVYFISLLGDTTILAGISFTFPVTMAISHLVFGFNIALASVVARLIGEKRHDDVRRIVLHGIMMGFGATAVICTLTYILLKPLFFAMGADAATFPVIADYMPLWLIACSVLAFPTKSNSAIRSAGDTFTPAMVMSFIALVNLILDPLLIFGLLGFPAMGVKGAALATLIAFSCGAVAALYIVIIRKKMVAVDGLHLGKFKDSARRLLVIAIPAGIANVIMPLSSAIITALLAVHGAQAVAAFGIVSRIEALALLVVIALATSMAPIIGQNWGAKKFSRVHETINLAIGFNLIWSAIVAFILAVAAHPIAESFSGDPVVIHYTVLFFWIVPVTYGVGNIVFGWSSAFNAMGMPKKAFTMIAVRALLMNIPAALIGSMLYGVIGIIASIALVNIISGIMFHTLSQRDCREKEYGLQEA
jgi:putative MATE family efflux protein